MIPLGPYPQLRLCPHVGNTPTNAKIRMIRRIVPIPICDPLESVMKCSEKITRPCGWATLMGRLLQLALLFKLARIRCRSYRKLAEYSWRLLRQYAA
jgi:hypothetical protein